METKQEPQTTATQGDSDKTAAAGKEPFKKTLKLAGASFVVADSALITSGLLAGKGKEAFGGVFGLMAGFVGARYGNPNAERQLDQIYKKLGAHLREKNITIPDNPTAEALSSQGGLVSQVESFLYDNPTQVMNVLYSLIGVQFLRSGIQHNTGDMKKSGALLIAGALAGLLIHEKKPDPEHPPEGTLQKAWSWIQEKPLRLTGTLFTANQFFLAKDALRERALDPTKKSYVFKLIAVASFVFGNTMMGLSSKSHGGGSVLDDQSLQTLAETSAKVIASQPPEVQKELLDNVALYLTSLPNVKVNAEDMSAMLKQRLTELSQGQALAMGQWQGKVQTAVPGGVSRTT